MNQTDTPLRFGICGLGFMGRTYFAHLHAHPRARVVAVCDRDAARRAGQWHAAGNIDSPAAARADLRGVRAYATPAELLRDPDVDAVAVTLPTPLHADTTIAALRAGKHVLCEKPMALDLAGCDHMIAAAAQTGRTLMIAHCIRFWPQYETISRLVADGRIGAVRFAKLARLASAPQYSEGNWLMDGAASGGALLDLHVHDVDFAQALLGVPQTARAHGRCGPSGRIDHVVALYGYPDGRYALLEGGWTYHAPWPFKMAITVCGELGTLTWSSTLSERVYLYSGGEQPEQIESPGQTGWQRQLDYFIDRVTHGRPVDRCPPASSRTSLALALLERKSIDTGTEINVRSWLSGWPSSEIV
jgi:predicted dehydrogenase